MPTVDQMRAELKQRYSGKQWKDKVDRMPDVQAVAIWYRILRDSEKRQDDRRKKEGVTQLELFKGEAMGLENIDPSSFECEKGWHPLIQETLKDIQKVAEREDLDVQVMQIKEKLGGLRIYLNNYSHEIEEIIKQAEGKALTICEVCGKPGFFGGTMDGWYMTRCMECMPKGVFLIED